MSLTNTIHFGVSHVSMLEQTISHSASFLSSFLFWGGEIHIVVTLVVTLAMIFVQDTRKIILEKLDSKII